MSSYDDRALRALRARVEEREQEAARLEAPFRRDTAAADRILSAIGAQSERKVDRRGRVRKFRWVGVLAPFAVAAGVALALGMRPNAEPLASAYVASVTGHVENVRAEHDRVFATLEANDRAHQEVVVRPATRVTKAMVAKVLLVRHGEAVLSSIDPEVAKSGVVRFDVSGTLLHDVSEVRVVIAPPSLLEISVAAAIHTPTVTVPRGSAVVVVPVQ